MEYKVEQIPLSRLALNSGQIEGLPANPRQWTREDVDRIAASLEETPELFDMRPIIAVQHGKEAIILAGSLRYCGAQKLGSKTAPCILLPEDMPVRKMQEIVLKDNGSFGAWDMDALANEWDALPLAEWGVPCWNVEEEVKKVEKDKDIVAQTPFTEVLGEEHNYIVLYFDNEVDWLQAQSLFELKPVKSLPTNKSGEQSLEFQKRIGVGRVLRGADALNKLTKI